jgi:predicted phosphate transport protein (TIGR00153 family)
LFAWFQRLLPKTGDFFGMFEAHSATLTAAADAMQKLVDGGAGSRRYIAEINDREHEADEIIREVLTTFRRSFLTPFDRCAITSLIAAMDAAIDEMQSASRAIDVYELTRFEPCMQQMAKMIVEQAQATAEAIPMLRDVSRKGTQIHVLTERIVRLEGHADDAHATGLKKAFHEHRADNPMGFIVAREIYKHLERITDAFEDVANEIDGIVIDHA